MKIHWKHFTKKNSPGYNNTRKNRLQIVEKKHLEHTEKRTHTLKYEKHQNSSNR